jgi:hypothetical protein
MGLALLLVNRLLLAKAARLTSGTAAHARPSAASAFGDFCLC